MPLYSDIEGLPPADSLSSSSVRGNLAAHTLISAILAAECLDEISDIDDGDGIRRCLVSKGSANKNGVLIRGFMFWVYPTGCVGPIETLEDDCERGKKGDVLHHGVLVTVEAGVNVDAATAAIKAALPADGLATLHVSQASLSALATVEI